jgi:hypothetical protein
VRRWAASGYCGTYGEFDDNVTALEWHEGGFTAHGADLSDEALIDSRFPERAVAISERTRMPTSPLPMAVKTKGLRSQTPRTSSLLSATTLVIRAGPTVRDSSSPTVAVSMGFAGGDQSATPTRRSSPPTFLSGWASRATERLQQFLEGRCANAGRIASVDNPEGPFLPFGLHINPVLEQVGADFALPLAMFEGAQNLLDPSGPIR